MPFELFIHIAAASALFMSALWVFAKKRGEADVVDAGWAFALGAAAIYLALVSDGAPLRRLLVGLIAGAWSLRLAGYLIFKRVLAAGEDSRYRELRERWGARADRNFFLFFETQALLVAVLSLSFYAAAANPAAAVSLWDIAGILLFVISIAGESAADRQLDSFRQNPANRGKTCSAGLWRYSRHPNYFFEWLHWLVYPLLAAGGAAWHLSLISPAIMLFLLIKVTGVPPSEKRAVLSRGDEYLAYRRRTSVFFPWPPREKIG